MRLLRFLRKAMAWLCESGSGYYYTGTPNDPEGH